MRVKGGVNQVSKMDERIRFTLRLPENLLLVVGREAVKTGVPINALILQILWDWVKKNERDSA